MPRGIKGSGTKKPGRKREVRYLHDGDLHTREKLQSIIDDGCISTNDTIFEVTAAFTIERGPMKMVPKSFRCC